MQSSKTNRLIILLDETRPMQQHKQQVINWFNDFLRIQQYVRTPAFRSKFALNYRELDLALYQYDSRLKLQQHSSLAKFDKLTDQDLRPAYATPLYQVLEQMLDENPEPENKTTVVIVSEAASILSENVDAHLTRNLSRRLANLRRQFGWRFVFCSKIPKVEVVDNVREISRVYGFDETYHNTSWENLWMTISDMILRERFVVAKVSKRARRRSGGRRRSGSSKSNSGTDGDSESVITVKSVSEPILPISGYEDSSKGASIPRNKSFNEISVSKREENKPRSTSFSCDEGISGSV